MRITNLVWGGTRTDRFDETVSFFRDVLGMKVADTQSGFASFKLPGGDKFEVFGPDDSDHDHFKTGPVIGFGVEDVDAARAELEGAGVEFIGPTRSEGEYVWAHFRGPDGNVYEIALG
jgi:catechol 2,3-dioxygenase-like lactoylglutathione lyase family enzyme